MSWAAGSLLGVATAMCAGAALACGPGPCPNPGDGWSDPYGVEPHGDHHARDAIDDDRYPHHHRRHAQHRHEGEITLPSSFFYGVGGVGPFPGEPVWSSGYVIVGGSAFAGASAFSAARASASASARVRVSGGFRSGGCCH